MLIRFCHFKVNYIIFDYTPSYPKNKLFIALYTLHAEFKSTIPDISFLKNILRLNKIDAQQKVLKVKYEVLIANIIWVLVNNFKDQDVLNNKQAFK